MKFKDFINESIRSRRITYRLVLIFGMCFLIYALILPKSYLSEGKILPQMDMGGLVSLAGSIGDIAGQESKMMRIAKAAGLSLGYSSADVIGALIMSRSIMEAVINDCGIFSEYNIDPKSMESALKQMKSITYVEISKEDIVILRCLGKSPQLSAKLVNSYINNLDVFLREKSMSKGKNMRIFMEDRLAQAEMELEAQAESLRNFQESSKVIVPEEEIKAAIDAYARLKGQLFNREVQSGIANAYSKDLAPYLTESRIEVEVIKKKLSELESEGALEGGFGVGFGIAFSDVPKIMQEYYRRYLNVRIQEEVYGFLKQQYEQARILEVKDTPVITVLDWGIPPERKHAPKPSRYLIAGLLVGLILGITRGIGILVLRDIYRNKENKKTIDSILAIFKEDIRALIRMVRRK